MALYKKYVADQLRGVADMVEAGAASTEATTAINYAAHLALMDIARRVKPTDSELKSWGILTDPKESVAEYLQQQGLVMVSQEDAEKCGIETTFFVEA